MRKLILGAVLVMLATSAQAGNVIYLRCKGAMAINLGSEIETREDAATVDLDGGIFHPPWIAETYLINDISEGSIEFHRDENGERQTVPP
jgi:hypothetical protein